VIDVGLVIGALALLAALALVPRIAARPGPDHLPGGSYGDRVAAPDPLDDVVQDQGNTVPLPGGRVLWIFADTASVTAPVFFRTSSAGIADGRAVRLRYVTGRDGVPLEFLPRTRRERAAAGKGRYTAVWPTGATTLPDGRILIAYTKYRVRSDPLEFRFLGAGLYEHRVDRFTDQGGAGPARRVADDIWTAPDGAIASPIYADGFVYFIQCEDNRCYSLRTTPDAVAERTSYRWWTGEGWSSARPARRAMQFGGDRPGRNPAIAYLPEFGVFALTNTSGGIQSRTGLIWVAPHPWGPWSAPAFFPLPGCLKAGCYTLNLHPESSLAGAVRVSYATAGVGPFVLVADVPLIVRGGGRSVATRAGQS